MPLETELKFPLKSFTGLRTAFKEREARFVSRHFEENLVFDRPDRSLKAQGILLRLRRAGNKTKLTLKVPPDTPAPDDVKVFQETECALDDFEAMASILEGAGLVRAFAYEKVREKWLLGDCVLCLDRLPFGHYLEIEGEREAIFRTARILGLEGAESTCSTYHRLNLERLAEGGDEPDESFVFAAGERNRLLVREAEDPEGAG